MSSSAESTTPTTPTSTEPANPITTEPEDSTEDTETRLVRPPGPPVPTVDSLITELAWRLVNDRYGFLIFNNVEANVARSLSKELSGNEWEGRNIGFGYDARFRQVRLRLANQFRCAFEYMNGLWKETWAPLLSQDSLKAHFSDSGIPRRRIDEFDEAYKHCIHEADYCVFPRITGLRSYHFPTFVIQEGTAEMHTYFLRDKDLWLKGTYGDTNVFMLIEVTKVEDDLIAFMEIWRKDGTNYRYMIIPRPVNPSPRQPFITVAELYGKKGVPDGLNPEAELPLELDRLRLAILKAARWTTKGRPKGEPVSTVKFF
ncbi:hypothetical protein TWF696_000818 [Orbilia brochopaga]|uniref:Uncharacterized protein n=1 Tax=Orbilia brochopaga TaxID=3140254 RepID=A0AAV9VES3_9PEZI